MARGLSGHNQLHNLISQGMRLLPLHLWLHQLLTTGPMNRGERIAASACGLAGAFGVNSDLGILAARVCGRWFNIHSR